jgi:hypothetical protein
MIYHFDKAVQGVFLVVQGDVDEVVDLLLPVGAGW